MDSNSRKKAGSRPQNRQQTVEERWATEEPRDRFEDVAKGVASTEKISQAPGQTSQPPGSQLKESPSSIQHGKRKVAEISTHSFMFQGMIKGVASTTSVKNSKAPGLPSHPPGIKPSRFNRKREKGPDAVLDLGQDYGRSVVNEDFVHFPSLKFEMGKFKPNFSNGIFPFEEKLKNFQFQPRRNSESNLTHHHNYFSKTTLSSNTASTSQMDIGPNFVVSGIHVNEDGPVRRIQEEDQKAKKHAGDDYNFRALSKKKGTSLSYEDILTIDVNAPSRKTCDEITTAPEITWREYKMMTAVLQMSSFEDRSLAQMLATDKVKRFGPDGRTLSDSEEKEEEEEVEAVESDLSIKTISELEEDSEEVEVEDEDGADVIPAAAIPPAPPQIARAHGLRDKNDPTDKKLVYEAIQRRLQGEDDNTCPPEGTDETWEFRKQRHQDMLRKREAEKRKAEFLQRRKQLLDEMPPEEIARLMLTTTGACLPGMEGLGQEAEFVYNDRLWHRHPSDESMHASYNKKPARVGHPGVAYLAEVEDAWKIDSFLSEGKKQGTFRIAEKHWAIRKEGTPFQVQRGVGITNWNLQMDIGIEVDPNEINSVDMKNITRDRPPNPPWKDGAKTGEYDDSHLDPDLRRMLRKPDIDPFPHVKLNVKEKKAKGKKVKAPKGIVLPPAPIQPPLCQWEFDNEEDQEGGGEEDATKTSPCAAEPNKEMQALEARIRLYERKQAEKKANEPWLEGAVGFSKQVCRFGLPGDMRELEGMLPRDYLSKFCFLSPRRARQYLAAFEQQLVVRKRLKFLNSGNKDKDKDKKGNKGGKPPAATPASSTASVKTAQSGSTMVGDAQSRISASVVVLTEAELQTTLSYQEVIGGILDVHFNAVTKAQCEELLEMLKLNEPDVRVNSPLFMAICALTERFYFSKFAKAEDPRMVSGKEGAAKLLIEELDFDNLESKIDGLRLRDDVLHLFHMLKSADIVSF